MPVQTYVAVCAWHGEYMLLGASSFEDVPLVEFMYLVFTCMPGGVTIGDSGLLLLYELLCLLILHRHLRPHSVSDYNNWLRLQMCVCVCVLRFICWTSFEIKGLNRVLNENWFFCMPLHTHLCYPVCLKCHWGHPFLRMYLWWSLCTLYLLACQVTLL